MKVGPSDFVWTLDERQVVRAFDDRGKLLATIGPVVNNVKLERVVDIAVDAAYGVYLLDAELRRIDVVALSVAADGRIGAEAVRTMAIPAEGDRALRNPSALAVTASGTRGRGRAVESQAAEGAVMRGDTSSHGAAVAGGAAICRVGAGARRAR